MERFSFLVEAIYGQPLRRSRKYKEISDWLFRLSADYGNIFRIFFGDQPAEQYMYLITEYIALFQSLADAINKNDVDSINYYTQLIYQNVANTAAFLAGINPYWTEAEWLTLLEPFTNMHIQEAITFLTKDYTTNINIYDRILALTTIIGDYFSEGLSSYFLLRFQQPQAT